MYKKIVVIAFSLTIFCGHNVLSESPTQRLFNQDKVITPELLKKLDEEILAVLGKIGQVRIVARTGAVSQEEIQGALAEVALELAALLQAKKQVATNNETVVQAEKTVLEIRKTEEYKNVNSARLRYQEEVKKLCSSNKEINEIIEQLIMLRSYDDVLVTEQQAGAKYQELIEQKLKECLYKKTNQNVDIAKLSEDEMHEFLEKNKNVQPCFDELMLVEQLLKLSRNK